MRYAILLAALACAAPARAQQAPSFTDITAPEVPIAKLERRAAEGDVGAMVQLGLAKLSGKRTSLDPDGGIRLLRAAAGKGSPVGAAALGMALESGFNGVSRDPAEGVRWLRFAYEHGDPRLKGIAANLLGFAYGRVGGIGRDEVESRRWYRLGAEAGDTEAMAWFGIMLVGAIGGPKDSDAAVPWLQRAAGAGDARATVVLAMLYFAGDGVPKDEAKAVELLRRAADGKNPHAAMLLAARYFAGMGVPEDAAQAAHYAIIGAEGGDKDAATLLAALYRMGKGIPVDLDAAERWGVKAAELGSTRGMFELAIIFATKHDEEKASYWLKRAADAGDPDAMFLFAGALERGIGMQPDRDRAIQFYRGAAAKGNQQARDALARLRAAP